MVIQIRFDKISLCSSVSSSGCHCFISHEVYLICEGGVEKSVSRITDWQHEACRVMTNDDSEGWIFLSHPHRNNGFFFLLATEYLILYWKNIKKNSRKS